MSICKSSVVRRYEVLQSKNRFYCCGRCMGSRQVGVFLLALILIVGTSLLFFIFDCPYLSEKLSIAIPIIGALLFTFVMCVLFRTACTDPGILPRSEKDEVLYNERLVLITMNANDQFQLTSNAQMPRYKEISIKGRPIKLKYCYTCKLYRPPRTSHCSVCDNCVERFDHHCPWMGNCIGKRNYRYFYMFLVSLSMFCLFVLACNIANFVIRTQTQSFIESVKATPATMVQAVICFFSMWSILCLCGYHTYLISSETSTNEDIKEAFSHKRNHENSNPFDRGSMLNNFLHVLCSSHPPSLIKLRETIPTNLTFESASYTNSTERECGGAGALGTGTSTSANTIQPVNNTDFLKITRSPDNYSNNKTNNHRFSSSSNHVPNYYRQNSYDSENV